MKYLLDTNICIFVIRQKPAALLSRFRQQAVDEVAVSSVTLAELRYGAEKSRDPARNHAALDAFLAPFDMAPFDAQAADWYGKLRADLERRGLLIGPLDMMIAAQALSIGVALITNNIQEFSRVTGLRTEDWTVS